MPENQVMGTILFIGTYFKSKKGSFTVSELLMQKLQADGYTCIKTSVYQNRLLRLADMLATIIFRNYAVAHIDVFSDGAFRVTRICSFFLRVLNKKIIFTLHGGKLPEFYAAHEAQFTQVIKTTDTITTPSKYLQQFFETKGYTVNYIPNFVNTSKFSNTGTQRKPFSLLWVRGFGPVYNPQLAINTLHEVLKQFPQATLTMVGPDAGLLAECKQLITKLGLDDKITITGHVAYDLLPDYYSSYSVYLNTTSYESFGMALMEAASCTIPIVSTSVGEIPYLWKEDEEMQLVHSFEAKEMAEKVVELLSKPTLASKMAGKAMLKAKTFDWENVKVEWQKYFSK